MSYYTNPGYVYPYPNTYPPQQSTTGIPQQTQNLFAWIQGEEAAKNYPVAPGNTVMLIEADKPVMYMKSTDLSGRPQPMQIRYLVSEDEYKKIHNTNQNEANSVDYVTKEYFDKRISELDNKFVLRRRDK